MFGKKTNSSSAIRILIVGEVFAFPAGYAASDYVCKLAKGLANNGAEVFVMPLHFTESTSSSLNTQWRGCHYGIPFAYAPGTPYFPRSSAGWRMRSRLARIHVWLRLIGMMLGSRRAVVLFYGRSFSWFEFFTRWTSRMGIALVPYIVEWTPSIPGRQAHVVEEEKKFYALAVRTSMKIVVISEALRTEFARLRGPKSESAIIMPVLCIPDDHTSPDDSSSLLGHPRFIYCADLNAYLADALDVIEAFNLLPDSESRLQLIGQVSPSNLAVLRGKISPEKTTRLEIKSARLTDDALRASYRSATALLLPGEDSLRNRMRFPSKLAEYLMSGRPVIASSVGEIPRYLEDGVSGLLIPPASTTALAHAMQTCLANPTTSDRIGLAGREVALHHFDANKACTRLLTWLTEQSPSLK